MARMRTVDAAYDLIREQDPETNVSKRFIRQLANENKIPTVWTGQKHYRCLINFDALEDYLAGNTAAGKGV